MVWMPNQKKVVEFIQLAYSTAIHLPDNMKTSEFIESIQKKLELPTDICQTALDKLHKNGFYIVAGLKTLRKDGWERLDLPDQLEGEMKSQIASSRSKYCLMVLDILLGFNPWYGM